MQKPVWILGHLHWLWGRVRWFVAEISHQFQELDLFPSAAALTYTTLFAVVPIMTVAYTILSIMPEFADLGEQVQAFIFANFVPASSELIQERLTEFSLQARQLTWAGIAFLILVAFRMLVSIERVFNRIWNLGEGRRGLQRFLLYWGVLTAGPPMIIAGLLISSYLFSLPLVADIDGLGLRETLLSYLPTLLSVAGFSILYFAMPNCRVPVLHAIYGGLLAAIGFAIAQKLFALSVGHMNTQLIYGAFAAVPLFLAWIYLVWVLILSGAIFVRTLSLEQDTRVVNTDPPLLNCLRVLRLLYQAHLRGDAVPELELSRQVGMNLLERERVYAVLRELGLFRQVDNEGLALSRSLNSLTLWDLYQRLPDAVVPAKLAAVTEASAWQAPLQQFAQQAEAQLTLALEPLLAASDVVGAATGVGNKK